MLTLLEAFLQTKTPTELGQIAVQYLLSAVTLYMTFLQGKKDAKAWTIGGANQVLWIGYVLWTKQYGLIWLNIGLSYLYLKNYYQWTKDNNDPVVLANRLYEQLGGGDRVYRSPRPSMPRVVHGLFVYNSRTPAQKIFGDLKVLDLYELGQSKNTFSWKSPFPEKFGHPSLTLFNIYAKTNGGPAGSFLVKVGHVEFSLDPFLQGSSPMKAKILWSKSATAVTNHIDLSSSLYADLSHLSLSPAVYPTDYSAEFSPYPR